MKEERDKFLTEAMGGCWHVWKQIYSGGGSHCVHCERYWPLFPDEPQQRIIQDCRISTWEGFGKLWEWAQKQEWWSVFYYLVTYGEDANLQHIIHPDRFAEAVYEFLKGRDL